MEVRTILVEPKSEENIGAVARVLKNFGFSELYLLHAPGIGKKALSVASHADDVLSACIMVDSIEEAIADSALVVGTTSKPGISANKHLRMPFFSPRELKEMVDGKRGILSLLFGREDSGLLNEELRHCDIIVCIPTNSDYPVMNLSHAVAVLLYELSDVQAAPEGPALAHIEDRERLLAHLRRFLNEIGYKEHKKEKTMLMLRRILGRAELTTGEVQTLSGILRKAEWKIGKLET
jgi:TrmH family RNA methyltransferase